MDTTRTHPSATDTGIPNAAYQSTQPASNMDPQSGQVDSLHQYATAATANQPVYQQYPASQQYPVTQQYPIVNPVSVESVASKALSAGVLGLIVVATGAMGANLHRVQEGEMKIGDAVTSSLAKGAAGGVAAAGATAAAGSFTTGGALGLAVTLAAGTGISYLLNK